MGAERPRACSGLGGAGVGWTGVEDNGERPPKEEGRAGDVTRCSGQSGAAERCSVEEEWMEET